MKITEIEIYPVAPAWIFIQIGTDAGLSGWGEISAGLGADIARAQIRTLSAVLLEADPCQIRPLTQRLISHAVQQGAPIPLEAISAVEMALWDIKGKALDAPIHTLLGGALQTSVSLTPQCLGRSARDLASVAKACRVRGFTCVTTTLESPNRPVNAQRLIEFTVERFSAIRDELGPEIGIGIDFEGRTRPALALRLADAIAPFTPAFIQDPCPDYSPHALTRVARQTRIPIVTGKRQQQRIQFRELLNACPITTIQPDVCTAGGMLETFLIASMAETYAVSLALQSRRGPVALAASLQLAACTPNIQRIEYAGMPNQWDLGRGYVETPFLVEHGAVALPEGPGLGLVMDLDGIKARHWDGQVPPGATRDAFDFD